MRLSTPALLLSLAIGLGPAAHAQDPAVSPRILIDPPGPVILGDPVTIRLTGFPPRTLVELEASGNADGRFMRSTAIFHTDEKGEVDLNRDAPVEGSYEGVDPSGPFWSMQPIRPGRPSSNDSDTVELIAILNDEKVAEATHERWLVHPDVTSTEVTEDGMLATFYDPGVDEPRPGILIVGGSGGGIGWQRALGGLLASHGYATLGLAYFRVDPLPPMLKEIPLEYFDTAMDWLAGQPSVASPAAPPGTLATSAIPRRSTPCWIRSGPRRRSIP